MADLKKNTQAARALEPLPDGAVIGEDDVQASGSDSESSALDWRAEQAALESRLAELRREHGEEAESAQSVTIVPPLFALSYSGAVLSAAMAGYNQTLARAGNEEQAVLDGISAAKQYKRRNNLR